MRARVSQATLRRLQRLDAPLQAARLQAVYAVALAEGVDAVPVETRRTFTRGQRTVLSWPPIADADTWELLAVAAQERLISDAREDREPAVSRLPAPSSPLPRTLVGPELERETITQAEHERLYREYRRRALAGTADYLKAKREQVTLAVGSAFGQ